MGIILILYGRPLESKLYGGKVSRMKLNEPIEYKQPLQFWVPGCPHYLPPSATATERDDIHDSFFTLWEDVSKGEVLVLIDLNR